MRQPSLCHLPAPQCYGPHAVLEPIRPLCSLCLLLITQLWCNCTAAMTAAPTCSSAGQPGSLAETVARLVQPGRGILAADESTSTVGKRVRGGVPSNCCSAQRFDRHHAAGLHCMQLHLCATRCHCTRMQLASVDLPNNEDNRRALREMLFTAPGIEKYISGVVRCRSGGHVALMTFASVVDAAHCQEA